MAITEDVVYSGANEKGGQPIGFFFASAAVTDAGETMVDAAMDANYDTLCTVRTGPNQYTSEGFDVAVFIDGTEIMHSKFGSSTSPDEETFECIVPAGKNLKITGDNKSGATITTLSAYIIIRPLIGSITV
jgi:hypothetical protein